MLVEQGERQPRCPGATSATGKRASGFGAVFSLLGLMNLLIALGCSMQAHESRPAVVGRASIVLDTDDIYERGGFEICCSP